MNGIMEMRCIFSMAKDVESACEQHCPSDKPYCSDVGCIFECPEPFYINGSNCVSHCGDWFVDENRNCVESCPSNTFYKEKLKQVQSVQYIERTCVRCSGYNQFVFNGSCVKVCPADSRHIDTKSCVNRCPAERPFKINITLFDLLHYNCVEKCPNLVDDNFCSDDCLSRKVIFNSSCVGQCPSSSPFLLSQSCLSECPKHAPSAGYENKTCVENKCPDERSYVSNNTCIESCPDIEPLMFSTYDGNSGFNYCVETCEEGQYRLNDHCVYECPSWTVVINDSCHEQCSIDAHFSCMVSKGQACGERPTQHFKHAICVDECPSTMLIWNQTCVFSCPSGIPIFGNECVENCPLDYPLQKSFVISKDCQYSRCREIKTVLTCVKECPSDQYIFNSTCFSFCQSPLLHKDNECVSKCPATKPDTLSTHLTQTIWSYKKYWNNRNYVQVKQDVVIQKCTSSCGDGTVILNSTCVTSCPEDFNFVHNGTCSQQKCASQYSHSTNFGTVCLDRCKIHQITLNKTCVDTCPDTYKYFNGTCVDQCPKSHMYTGIAVKGETCSYYGSCSAQSVLNTCVEKCANGSFIYNGTCVTFCRKPLFTFKNKCVESCPLSSPHSDTSSVTVEKWTWGGNHFKKTSSTESIVKCVSVCSEDKALFGSKCVTSCPAHSRFIKKETCVSEACSEKYKYFSSPGIKCFNECPKDLFVFSDTCVQQCPEDLFVLGQNCITDCPPTHEIIDNAIIIQNKYNCTNGHLFNRMCAKYVTHVKKCQKRCPENKFLYNNTCLDLCLTDTYIFNNTCVSTCPISHPFIQPTITTTMTWTHFHLSWQLLIEDGWYLTNDVHEVKKCVEKCPNDYPLRFGYDCFDKCPGTAPFTFSSTCVKKCPEDKLLDVTTKFCVDKCGSDRGLFNKTCYSSCPSKHRYIHNSLCVSKCPSSAPVALAEDRFICRKSCPDDKLFKDGECIYSFKCDDQNFAYDGLCIPSCPEGYVWFVDCHNRLGPIIAIPVLAVILLALLIYSWQSITGFFRISKLMFVSEEKIMEFERHQRQLQSNTVNKRNKKDDEISLRRIFFETEYDDNYFLQTDNDANAGETRL